MGYILQEHKKSFIFFTFTYQTQAYTPKLTPKSDQLLENKT